MATLGFSMAQLGWNLLFYAGATLLTRALAPKPKPIEGPRLDDLKLTNSAYGSVIARGYGTSRVGGNLIWGLPIREQRHTERVSGKGGGPSQKIVTWSYYFTGAVAVGEGEIDDILRIWADSKLIFDRGGLPDVTEREARRAASFDEFWDQFYESLQSGGPNTGTTRKGWRFKVYKGTEDQLPDATIEADIGEGQTVPHRGLAYVVFDDCALADFGNRVPVFSFEVAWKATPVQPIILPTYLPDSNLSGVNAIESFGAIAWEAGIYFVYGSAGAFQPLYVGVFDINTNREILEFKLEDATGFDMQSVVYAFAAGRSGYLYVADYVTGSDWMIWKINPQTAQTVWFIPGSGYERFPSGLLEFSTDPGVIFPGSYFLVTAPFFDGSFCLYHAGIDDPTAGIYMGSIDCKYPGLGVNGTARLARGYHDQNYAEAWAMDSPITQHSGSADYGKPLYLHRLRLQANAWGFLAGGSPNILEDPDQLVTYEIYPGDLAPWYGSPSPTTFREANNLVFDATPMLTGSPAERDTGHPMLFVTVAGGAAGAAGNPQTYLIKVNAETGAIMWAVPDMEPPPMDENSGEALINNGVFAFTDATAPPLGYSSVTFIDTINGEVIDREDWTPGMLEYGVSSWLGSALYDSQREAIISSGTSTASPYIVLLNRREGEGVPLWYIVQQECLRAGYVEDDLDVSALQDLVLGYHVADVMSARAAIEPLAVAYQFDGCESDWRIKFPKRGTAPVVTITQDHLAVLDEETGAVLFEQRTPDKELPERITVNYYEKDRDYETGSQYAKRRRAPVRSMESERHINHNVPVVFRALEVKQRCEWLLYEAWVGRTSLEARVSWAFLRYDPLDVVTVTLNDGTTFKARIVDADVGADWNIAYRLVTEDEAVYSQTAVVTAEAGIGGGYDPTVYVANIQNSQLMLIDAPLLLDTDDTGRLVSKLYVTAAPSLGLGVWPGATIYQSSDGSTWATATGVSLPAAWGSAVEALGDVESPWVTDRENTLVVNMVNGADQLETVTDLQLLNGANAALLINRASGDVELLQFRDVLQVGPNKFELSHLLRGRRGTDTMTGNHAAGDLLLVPSALTVSTLSVPLAALGSDRYFRAVTNGSLVESGASTTQTIHGRDLMPYAPCQQEVEVAGSDLVLSWVRRSRLGGEWLDGGESPPLAEDSERYEADIYDGALVVRTLAAGGTSAVTYTAAQIAADFGSMPPTLTWAVYQLSAQVGRGFGEAVTCDVPGRA